MTSKLTELGKAIMHLISEYDRAKEADHIHKPISYALYQTWKVWDSKEKARGSEEKPNAEPTAPHLTVDEYIRRTKHND